jgi:hypothetical protein
MSTSRHPIAYRLERTVGEDFKLLATVMGLPLVDGIFPALVLAGALGTAQDQLYGLLGVFEVGLLVFGGSATAAVILAEMDGSVRETARAVAVVGTALVAIASVEAALAPTIQALVDLATFERFAALVMAAIAAKTASATIGEYLPRPGVIVVLGIIASIDVSSAALAVRVEPALVARAAGAALVGTLFAFLLAVTAPRLRAAVDIDRFRFGSAVALGLLPLSILGYGVGGAPLAVLGVTALFAYDPDHVAATSGGADTETDASATSATVEAPPAETAADAGDFDTTHDDDAPAGDRTRDCTTVTDGGCTTDDDHANATTTASDESYPPWR